MVMSSPPLILHDYFAIRGGGERLVLTLAGVGALTLHLFRPVFFSPG